LGSPSAVVAAMWNHGSRMESQAQKQAVELPVLTGQELADITTYLGSLGRRGVAPPKTK
jgi:hypothetical protein